MVERQEMILNLELHTRLLIMSFSVSISAWLILVLTLIDKAIRVGRGSFL